MEWLSQVLKSMTQPLKWWVVIAPWEQGLLVRLGKSARRLDPGPHFRIPFVDRVYVQSVRVRTITAINTTAASRDAKTLTVSYAVRFSIVDVAALYASVATPEATMRSMVEGLIVASAHLLDAAAIRPESIETAVNERLPSLEAWGLRDISCSITGFAIARTYRLLQNDYQQGSGIANIEEQKGER